MIELFTSNKQDISMNGYILDQMVISCVVSNSLNGGNDLEMEIVLDNDGLYKKVKRGCLITVYTPDFEEKQAYRIYNTVKYMRDRSLMIYARHVQFDLNKKIVFNKNVQGNGQQVLDKLLEDTKFKGTSESKITDIRQYKMRNITNILNGSEEDSFINIWGGEFECNNYNLNIPLRRGKDRGLTVAFGYNLIDIEEEIEANEIVTRIYPYSGDLVLGGNTPYVDSPLIAKYEDVYEKAVEMSDIKVKERTYDSDGKETTSENAEGFNTIEEARAEMIARCKKLYDEGVDKIKVNYKVKMANLARTKEYKKLGYDKLEKLCLGDTIHCYNRNIDVEVEARCISYKWDCLKEGFIEIELGQYLNNYIDNNLDEIDNLYRKIILEKQYILLRVDSLDNTMHSEIKITEDKIHSEVVNTKKDLQSTIEQTANSITSTVTDLKNNTNSQIKQLSNEISSKVEEEDFGSLIQQHSRDVRISWNKISNYAQIDDTEGLILGNQDEGSYTKVGYNGRLELCTGKGERPYHCLQYTDYEDIKCTDEDYKITSISLPSIFKDIDDDNISISVSVQKVYKNGEYMPYWFGGYGEIKNGKIVLYAMSAWRRYYYDSNSDSRWVEEFGEPVGGSIILRYTVIA